MHRIFPILLLLGCGIANAQVTSIDELMKQSDDNIYVEALNHDAHVSSFLIWVESSVRPHYHAEHTEVVYVLQGEGIMTLGTDTIMVSEGDHIFIPPGTPHSVEVKSTVPMKVLSIQTPEFDGTDRVFLPAMGAK